MNNTCLRAEVYLLLSEAFKRPVAEFVNEQKDMVSFLTNAFSELGYNISPELYCQWASLADNLAILTDAYQQSFIYPIQSRVVPVESIYRRWTQDTTAEVPFAGEKGQLMSDYALHMNTLYNAFGLTIPSEYQGMPDHLCLELEFAAYLLLNETPDRYRGFLTEHLNWVDELSLDADKQQIPVYYRQLIKITAQFLSLELRRWQCAKF